MINSSRAIRVLRPMLSRYPRIKGALRQLDELLGMCRHLAARPLPFLIRPAPRQITIAITSRCNLRCMGCRYGRDFMVGARLSLETVRGVLDDARAGGVNTARFYGGEPLLHPDLPAMIEHAVELGLDAYITTNGTLLAERCDDLFRAGLRWMTIGFYGLGADYDGYTQSPGHFERLRRGIETVRERFGDEVAIQINFVLSRRSCSVAALRATWKFARRYDLYLGVDPISRTIPFFKRPGRDLAIGAEQGAELAALVAELVRIRKAHPERVPPSLHFLRAIPDLLLGDLRVPCDAYQLLWVGADGSVQLCDVCFALGNVNEQPLREILGGAAHRRAARRGFRLECPNCLCKIDSRIRRHAASRLAYRGR